MRTFLFAITLLLFASASFADSITVTLDTSSLAGSSSGPYTLDFQFIDGNGTGDGNNTVVLSDFLVTAGSIGSPSTTGSVTLKSSPFGITMVDSSFFNEAQVPYTPGTTLTFDASYTTSADSTAPDSFTFAILDGMGNEIPTTNPNSFNSFLEIDLPSGSTATVITPSGSTDGSIPEPIVLPGGSSGSTAPEPATLFLIAAAAPIWMIRQRRLRSQTGTPMERQRSDERPNI